MRVALITTDNREDRRDYTSELPWFGTAVQALLDGFAELPDEIEVHVLSCTRAHLPSPLQLAPNIIFHSIHVPSWAWLKTFYLANIIAVRNRLKKIRPDIVHGQGTERDCALAAAFSGYPNLITLHGNMRQLAKLFPAPLWSFSRLTAFLESVALRMAGGCVCLSTHSRKLVAPLAKQTWLVPNAVDPAFLAVDRAEASPLPLILMVGDVTPNKNQLAFLNAVAPLQTEFDFKVRIFGKSDPTHPYTSELLNFIAKNPWCVIGDFLNRESLKRQMASATLLALPSLEENLPMVILEAMAIGLPVAASHVGGIPDMIKHGQTGILFDPRDPESIRKALRSMLMNPTDCNHITVQAHENILLKHLPQTIARRHLQVYQDLLKENCHHPTKL